ncbi:MAG: HAMP domain-containing protein [Calditrichaeota bacterium]|nr:HAMP domain-containing protein [Calditrichota bacterium]
MKIKTVRTRLTLWYSGILFLILAIFSATLLAYFHQNLKRGLDQAILTRTAAMEHSIEESGGHIDLSEIQEMDYFESSSLPKFIQIMNPDRQILVKSLNLGDFSLTPTPEQWKKLLRQQTVFGTRQFPGKQGIRYACVPFRWRGSLKYILIVGMSLESIQRPVSRLRMALLLFVPILLILAGFGGWFLAGKSLRPLKDLTQRAQTITVHRLNQPLAISGAGQEIQELIDVFNEMIRRLDTSFRQIKQFTADASHELRTPLTVIKGESEVALRADRKPEAYKETLRRILEEADYMARIVESLLFLSRIDAGQLHLKMEPVNLLDVAERVVAELSFLARQKNIRLIARFDQSAVIIGDAERLEQVIKNLVDNSLKYTEPGGEVVIDVSRTGDHVILSVSDTGMGIPTSDLPHVFDRFYRVDKSRSRKIGGSGLGLSIVKWIVDAHKAQIDIQSEEGSGTTVRVVFPAS